MVCISDVCFAYFRFEKCCVLLLLVGVLCMFHACVCNCFVCLVAWFMYLYTISMLFVCFALPSGAAALPRPRGAGALLNWHRGHCAVVEHAGGGVRAGGV